MHAKYKRGELRCKVCNEIIPIGSKRRYYCSNECRKEVLRVRGRDNMRKRKMKMKEEMFGETHVCNNT
jgi:predicted nucleic acid-binding Zn ribbon protein